jgi:hypothetical protein
MNNSFVYLKIDSTKLKKIDTDLEYLCYRDNSEICYNEDTILPKKHSLFKEHYIPSIKMEVTRGISSSFFGDLTSKKDVYAIQLFENNIKNKSISLKSASVNSEFTFYNNINLTKPKKETDPYE